MIYYFVYETTCLINSKKYRGIHKTKNIQDGYIGSGRSFKLSVKKYGKENFTREILEFCSSYDELLEKEKIYVDEDWVKDKSNYNLKTGGQSAGILSEESRKKQSETLSEGYRSGRIVKRRVRAYITTPEINKKISDSLKEKYEHQEHNRSGKDPWNKNKPGSQVGWNKGLKTGPQSEESKKKKSETLKERFKNQEHHSKGVEPWNKGKTGVQEAWNKGKEMKKSKCKYCDKEMDILNLNKYHNDNCKQKPNDN